MNANAILLGLAVLAILGAVPTAAADVTLCHYNQHEGCVGGGRTVETDLVDCEVRYWIPFLDCVRCPVGGRCV